MRIFCWQLDLLHDPFAVPTVGLHLHFVGTDWGEIGVTLVDVVTKHHESHDCVL